MNERIKQLAEQATTYIKPVPGHSGEGWVFDEEKFAELIIKECIDICEKDGRWWADQGYLMEAGEAGSLATQIKEHFGVK